VSAKPLPRGGLVAVPEQSAVLNGPAVLKTFDGVRGVVKAPPLTRSGCLDTAATSLAASFNGGTVVTTAPTGLIGEPRHLGLAVGPRRESGC
jgi:hypothetical protein